MHQDLPQVSPHNKGHKIVINPLSNSGQRLILASDHRLKVDLVGKWGLCGRGEYLDAIIYLKMFPIRHTLTDADIASSLAKRHPPCVGMTGQDVVDLYSLFETYPELPSNGFRLWQGRRESDLKIRIAIGRLSRP